MVTAMTVVFFLLLSVLKVEATPIQPDIRKVLQKPTQSPTDFAPARAGWDGPETPSRIQSLNTTYEQISPAATAREIHHAVLATVIPDYRVLAGVLLAIMLLRRLINSRRLVTANAELRPATSESESTGNIEEQVVETPRAA